MGNPNRDKHIQTDGDSLEAMVLKSWTTTNMKRGGRTRTQKALSIVGNFNGAAGFAIGKACGCFTTSPPFSSSLFVGMLFVGMLFVAIRFVAMLV
jgi:hypothetical protein